MKGKEPIRKLPDWRQFSLREQIGQMVVVRASGYLFDHQIRYPAWEPPNARLRHWLQTLNLGGVILLGGSAAELALRSRQLQQWSPVPLLVAADVEEGVGQRFSGATWFPPPMALGAIARQDRSRARELAAQMGAIAAREALAVGLNWLLAPVVDVNNNPDNPVINVRSFADTPEIASELAAAFIRGAQPYPILTAAKHFPGHGDTATDSHLELPVLPHSPSRLEAVELPPFRAAIAAGVDAVMSGHLLVPAWDGDRPATLSPAILTGQLRQRLGFEGVAVTDALIMGGVASGADPGEVAVMAVEAGADILLMPADPEVAIAAVEGAVRSGRLAPARIGESLARLWQAKGKVTSPPISLAPPLLRAPDGTGAGDFALAQPGAREIAAQILRGSMRAGGALPLKPSSQGRNLIVVDDCLSCDYLDRHVPAIAVPQSLGYEGQLADRRTLPLAVDELPQTLLQVFLRGNPFRGSAGLDPKARGFYQELLRSGRLQGLAIYGSPYLLDWFLSQLPAGLPWVFSYGQMPLSQAIACEVLFELPGTSHLDRDEF